jgi:hypothetical protein
MTRAAAPLRPSLRDSDIIGAPSLANWAPLLRPIGAALVVSGLTPEVQSYLRDALPPGAPREASAAPQASTRAASPLRPGDPVGMSLVRGDMEMGATGTVTYVDGTRVYAFGHPFLGLGPTEMAMTQAHVLTVLPSLDSSMKIATMGPVIGRMTQDRATGVGGVLGQGPNELAVALTIETPGVPVRRLHFNVLHDQSLTPLFAYVAIFNTLNSYQRQSGGASIAATGSITYDGLGTLPIDDAFTGEQAVSLAGATAMNPIGALASNEFRRVLPQTLDLTLRVSERDDFATIERAWLDTTRPTLGGTHTLHVMLRQYRGGTEVVSLPITMPAQASGPVTVLVTDGPSLAALEQKELRPEATRSVEALFNRLRDGARPGNHVYVRLLSATAGTAVAGEALPALPASVLAALDADASVGSAPLTRTIVGAWDRRLSRVIRGTREFTITLRPAAPPS